MLPEFASGWDAWHPLIVHFPIALLLVVPFFLLAGVVFKSALAQVSVCALGLMFLGVVGAWVAFSTGEDAGRVAVAAMPEVADIVEQHEESARTAAMVFTVLLLGFGARMAAPLLQGKPLFSMQLRVFSIAFLMVYAVCTLMIVDAAHLGGRLVHEFGVRSRTTRCVAPQPIRPPVEPIR